MKFSHSLKYNAVPEWQDHYIDYSHLKKLIYSLQNEELKQLSGNKQESSESAKNGADAFKFWKKSKTEDAEDAGIETIELSEYKKSSSKKSKFHFDFDRRSSSASERTVFNPQDVFLSRLTIEKQKVDDFYKRLEAKLFSRFDTLTTDLQNAGFVNLQNYLYNEAFEAQSMSGVATRVKSNQTVLSNLSRHLSIGQHLDNSDEEEDFFGEDGDEEDGTVPDNTALLNYSDYNPKSQKKSILKKKVTDLYVDLAQLKSFIELNRMGFLKISKKFDKTLNCTVKKDLIESGEFFDDTHIFLPDTFTNLDDKISYLIYYYSVITDQENDLQTCKDELRSYLRDYIVWERNTVWKDLLGLESQQNDFASAGRPNVNGEISTLENLTHLEYYSYHLKRPINLKLFTIDKLSIPKLFFTLRALKIYFIIVFTIVLLAVKTFNDEAQHRCMALVECVALLWATEAIPLFVTAMLVPFLAVLFRVVKDDDTGAVMSAASASSYLFGKMWSSTIMVLLAGFTLAAALSKYNIAKVSASYILSIAGSRPRNLLIVVMAVVFFLSIWISNVAAPVLTYSLIQTVLRTLDSETPFAKALVLGVALAADIGGMASPISSPQNVFAMDYLTPYGIGWGQFFAVALPVSIVSVILIWLLLILTFKINTTTLKPYKPIKEKFTLKQYYIIVITMGTILLWCVLSKIEGVFGSAGVIAVLPIVLFFGTGLLTTHDINNFPWSIVLLAMGGIALGSAVSSSGLLVTIAVALQRRVESYPTYAVLCIFGIIMLVFGTFVSHTVSAIIIVPLVQEIGEQLPSENAAPILVFGCTLLASCGMGLASSGFPNVTAISMTDEVGNRYLSVNNFITRGVPASLLAFVVVITIGYGIMVSIL